MAFKLENIFLSVGIMIIALTVILNFYSFELSNYGVTGDTSVLGGITTKLSSAYSLNDNMKSTIQGVNVPQSDAINAMVGGSYDAARNNPFSMATTTLNATQTIVQNSGLGIDPIFYQVFVFMLSVVIVWGIIYLVMRYRVF